MIQISVRRRLGRIGLSLLVATSGTSLLWVGSAGTAFADPGSPNPVCQDGTCTVAFTAETFVQGFHVPAGVRLLTATVVGASGASNSGENSGQPAIPGAGGLTKGTFAVQPGSELSVVTGKTGQDPSWSSTSGGPGGFGGGGVGGNGVGIKDMGNGSGGGGGGGGSFLFGESGVLLAAGGGGGGSVQSIDGGAGGGAFASASKGSDGNGQGGTAATADTNGIGGTSWPPGGNGSGPASSADALPVGGAGGSTDYVPDLDTANAGGGGGGGGYRTGGGGGASNSVLQSGFGSGGGGGAGYAAPGTTDVYGQAGVQVGDGSVVITYADTPSLTFISRAPTGAVVSGDAYTVAATGAGSGAVSYALDPTTTNGACSLDGRKVSFRHVGICAIKATQEGDATQQPASSVQSFVVGKGTAIIDFTGLPATSQIGDTLTLEATASVAGSTVALRVGNGDSCSIDGTKLLLTASGTCTVQASLDATDDYEAAVSVTQMIAVNRIATATSLSVDPQEPAYGQDVTATAMVTGARSGAMQFSVDGAGVGAPVVVEEGSASKALPGGLAAGGHEVEAVFTPSDQRRYEGSTNNLELAVAKALTKATLEVRTDQASVVVSAVAPARGTPDGDVIFTVNGKSSSTQLDHGRAALSVPVPDGATISVEYVGGEDFAGSSDSVLHTDPAITAAVTSRVEKSRFGWYRTPVTITFSCKPGSAALSRPCPGAVVLSKDGPSQGATRTVTADDGGIATVSVTGIDIDRTDPELTSSGVSEGDRFFRSAPEAGCLATDDLSGIHGCSATRKVKGDDVTYLASAVDRAGNVAHLRVHASTYRYGVAHATYADGVYTVEKGQHYDLVAASSNKPRLYKITSGSKTPSDKAPDSFRSTGDGTWAFTYSMGKSLKPGKTYNLGIKTNKLHVIKIHVV